MTPSQQIGNMIAKTPDWRGELLSRLRQLINEADPTLKEEWKWGVPVWTKNGLVCAISAFKGHVKMNFFKGFALPDPDGLFNNGFDSKEHRSIDFSNGDKINEAAIQDLVRAAAAYNMKQ